MLRPEIGIDLGTANILIYLKGKGIVVNEPSVVAINKKTKKVLAVGKEAKKMVGKTPSHIVAVRPLMGGVISDFEITEEMIRYFLEKIFGRRIFPWPKARVVIGVPSQITEVERKAVEDAVKNAGAGEVYLLEEPMVAAIGVKLPIEEAAGIMIVDIGGGTTEIAVISLGGIVISSSLKIGGMQFDQDIKKYTEEELKLIIGERTAEDIKIKIGSALPLEEKLEAPLRGRDIGTGLPKEVMVSSDEIREAILPSLNQIKKEVKNIIEETPPELLADIMARGIYLVGGGALLKKMDEFLEKATQIPVRIPEDPLTAVCRGCGVVLENLSKYREVLIPSEKEEPLK